MPTFTCKALLFDMDGTLIDSMEHVVQLWSTWSKRRGLDTARVLEVMPGLQTLDTIRLVAPLLDAEKERNMLLEQEVRDLSGIRAYPGVAELVSRLRDDQWAVVTSALRPVAEARLRHTGIPTPKVFITAEMVERGKPAPDGYLLAAQQLGAAPQDCIVLEDAVSGVAAGKAAGMRVISPSTTQPREALRAADAVISSISALHVEQAEAGILVRIDGD
jgi:sugar-phosphatase